MLHGGNYLVWKEGLHGDLHRVITRAGRGLARCCAHQLVTSMID